MFIFRSVIFTSIHRYSPNFSVSSAMSEDVVPVEEYDELSKLVDKLLTEKAQLQLAVEKQADQLKVIVLFLVSCFLFCFCICRSWKCS